MYYINSPEFTGGLGKREVGLLPEHLWSIPLASNFNVRRTYWTTRTGPSPPNPSAVCFWAVALTTELAGIGHLADLSRI